MATTTERELERGHTASLPAGARRRGDGLLRRVLATGDLTSVVVALLVSVLVWSRRPLGTELLWGLAALPLFLVTFKLYGLYDRCTKRVSYSTVDDLPWLFHAVIVGELLFWLYARVTPFGNPTLGQSLTFGAVLIPAVTVARLVLRRMAINSFYRERALIIGTGASARTFLRKLEAHPEYGLDVVGSATLPGVPGSFEDAELAVLGDVGDLRAVVERHRIRRVVLAPEAHDFAFDEILRRCRSMSLKVTVLPRLSDVLGSAVQVDDIAGLTVLQLDPPLLPRSSRAIKRALDLAIAGVLLVLTLPVLAVIAVLVRLDSPGPVLFRQERVGRGGKRFRVLKFRTMAVGAEARRDELLPLSSDPNWLKLDDDPRVTRLGRWLRSMSLDELPQLWNVMRGEMSIVGPRPLIPAEDEKIRGWGRGRLDLTPGITGYWQVLGRTRIPFEEMVKLDYLYVMNWSLWEDVRLMMRTLPTLWRHRQETMSRSR